MAYDKKIEILISSDIEDEVGNIDCVWKTVMKAWAQVNSTGGRTYYEAAKSNTQNYMIFKVRYSSKISNIRAHSTRIRYKDRLYEVQHIDDYLEQHLEIVMRADEVPE